MKMLDLRPATNGKSTILAGFEKGQRVRNMLQVDDLDDAIENVIVLRGDELRTIAPSFVQGLFGKSAVKMGRDGFFAKYHFDKWPPNLVSQVEAGVLRALMTRDN